MEKAQTQTPSKPKPTSPAQQPNPAQQTNPRPNSPLFLHSLRRGPLFSPSHRGPASSEFSPFPHSPTLFLSPAARAPFGPLSTRARPARPAPRPASPLRLTDSTAPRCQGLLPPSARAQWTGRDIRPKPPRPSFPSRTSRSPAVPFKPPADPLLPIPRASSASNPSRRLHAALPCRAPAPPRTGHATASQPRPTTAGASPRAQDLSPSLLPSTSSLQRPDFDLDLRRR